MAHPIAIGKFQLLVGCWQEATVLHMDGPLYRAICNFVSPSASERERQGQTDTGTEGGKESLDAFNDLISEVIHHHFCYIWFGFVV